MLKYLIKILLIVWVWLYISNIYYNDFSFHKEKFDWYTPYVLFTLINYFIYKIYTIFINYKENLEFSPLKIFWFFSYFLLFFSFFFFYISGLGSNSGLILFFWILWYLVIPFLITIFSYSFWNKIISFIEEKYETNDENKDSKFLFLMSLWLGFSAFIFILTILWSFWLYNIYSVIWILIFIWLFSYKNLINSFKSLYTYKIKIENHKIKWNCIIEKINPYLLSTEFLFIIIVLLIPTNFISIFRPTPIGWDDMWVYMNYPQLMAWAGDLLSLWLVSWQTLTWIGFMIWSATQAFFINNLGSILSIIVLVISFSSLLKKSKTLINIPLLLATIFLAMPMVIFQQAKDMKLDTGLFFISSIVIFWIIHIFIKYLWYKDDDEKQKSTEGFNSLKFLSFLDFKKYFSQNIHYWNPNLFNNKKYLFYIFILWIITWFAFTIKVTSLLLISWIIWILFYTKLWFSGFLWYLAIFFWIFTKFSLWDYMGKINYPKDDLEFKNTFFIISITIWTTFILYSINKYKIKAFTKLLTLVWTFILWILLFLSPFFAKHITETISADKKISIWSIISWTPDRFVADYTKIMSKEKLEEIELKHKKEQEKERKNSKTKNEDFWRYFGYEEGINNYIKLPYNLSMQKNQKWEFTDITYIFLALIPIIFLFLNFKNSFTTWWILVIFCLESLIFFTPKLQKYFTELLAKFEFPFWYLILLFIFLASLFLFLYWLKKDKNSQIFRLISVFLIFYIFLWSIAAFWVIWYWIAMFYWLLLIIWIWLTNISSYNDNEILKNKLIKFFWSFSVFLIISIYFFGSTFPHSFKNIKNSAYAEYKSNAYSSNELTFWYNPWRLEVLFALNIAEDKKEKFLIEIINNSENIDLIWNFARRQKAWIKVFSDVKIFENILKNFEMEKGHDILWELIKVKPEYEEKINSRKISINVKNIKNFRNLLKNNKQDFEILDKIDLAKKELYKRILKPKDEYKNKEKIYRIGTFYKYFIIENHKRFYNDNLINNYHKYFKAENIDKSIENMKKIWLSYLLMDVNAATIDNDPRHDLTRRYENLLDLITSKNLELISTDSICLKIALESYNKKEITKKQFIRLAWVNYDSYWNKKLKYSEINKNNYLGNLWISEKLFIEVYWKKDKLNRVFKKNECWKYMYNLQKNKKIDANNYRELSVISKKWIKEEQIIEFLKQKIWKTGWDYALFKLK